MSDSIRTQQEISGDWPYKGDLPTRKGAILKKIPFPPETFAKLKELAECADWFNFGGRSFPNIVVFVLDIALGQPAVRFMDEYGIKAAIRERVESVFPPAAVILEEINRRMAEFDMAQLEQVLFYTRAVATDPMKQIERDIGWAK